MTIIFNNPHGAPVRINKEHAVVVDTNEDGITYAATDPVTGTTMVKLEPLISEHHMDDPMGPTAHLEDQIVSGQLNDMEDMDMPDVATNPPKKLFTWRNLRLQSAISGQDAFMGRVGRAFEGSIPGDIFRFGKRTVLQQIDNKFSIRDSPFLLQLTTVSQWYQYVKTLQDSPIDVGAELSMTVSPSQRIAVAMFVKEWEQDPGHRTLMRRVSPGAEPSEVIGIGNMIYDIITGRGPDPLNAAGYGSFAYDKMFRLAYDMLLSLPINLYNTYTLFQLEADEGGKIYSEVVSNYTPLEVGEVGMVLELQQKLAEFGPGYANVVISDTGLAAEAGALMNKAVSAYSSGDTVSVRSILNYLQDAPFYYMTPVADAKSIFVEGQTPTATGVHFGDKVKDAPKLNGLVYLKGLPAGSTTGETGKLITAKDAPQGWKGNTYDVVKSPFDNTVVGVLKFGQSADKATYVEGATVGKDQNRGQKRDAAAEISEALAMNNPRGNPEDSPIFLGYVEADFDDIVDEAQKEANKIGKSLTLVTRDMFWDEGMGEPVMGWYGYTERVSVGNTTWDEEGRIVDPQLNNPRGKPQGRGKFLELQIHPKPQLTMKLQPTNDSGTGDKRHGRPPKGKNGSQNTWSKGLYKLLNTRIDEMNFKMRKDKSKKQKYPNITVMVHGGILKKTGNWAPYRIKLPKSHFVKSRLPDGTEVVGMKKSLSDKELVAAWRKFTDEYGMFKVQRKDNEMFFIPHKRGAYYEKVRRQIGGAKGSR
jgi:hypothetical protein